jgi:DNA-binding transcriptional ArsR family regulator
MSYEAAILALSDPTRRAIVEALRDEPLPVGALARRLPVSRPAVSQHLRVLSDAGLVTAEPAGTRRVYRLAPEGLEALRRWLDRLWDDALVAYASEARKQSKSDA